MEIGGFVFIAALLALRWIIDAGLFAELFGVCIIALFAFAGLNALLNPEG